MLRIIMLLMVTGAAYGEGKPTTPSPDQGQNQAQDQTQGQQQTQDQSQSQDQSSSQANSQSSSVIVGGDRQVRQAPSVALGSPTIPGSKLGCLKGFNLLGSNPTGTTAGNVTWRQFECQAKEDAQYLASLGLYAEAGRRYCVGRNVDGFANKADCRAKMAVVLKPVNRVNIHVKHIEIDAEKHCEGRSNETVVVKEYLDTHGYSVLYDCVARNAKSG